MKTRPTPGAVLSLSSNKRLGRRTVARVAPGLRFGRLIAYSGSLYSPHYFALRLSCSREISEMRVLIGILFLLFIWLQYRLWVGEGSLAEVYNLRNEIDRQQQQLDELQQRNQVLEAEVRDLKTGMEAMEERARTELGMIREGEVYYQVLESGPNSDSPEHDQ